MKTCPILDQLMIMEVYLPNNPSEKGTCNVIDALGTFFIITIVITIIITIIITTTIIIILLLQVNEFTEKSLEMGKHFVILHNARIL